MENNIKEIKDEDLENVTGGKNLSLHFFDTEADVKFIFNINDIVYVKKYFFSKTVKCKVKGRKAFNDPQYHCYTDIYHVETVDYKEGDFYYLNENVSRDDIVNQVVE